MRDINELEITGSLATATQENIDALEKHFHVTFPDDYVQFLFAVNGGSPALPVFNYTLSSGREGASAVSKFFYATGNNDDQYGIWYNTEILRSDFTEYGVDRPVIAIGENGGGDMIYLDTSAGSPGVFIFFYASEGSTPKISDTFTAFINQLRPVEEL